MYYEIRIGDEVIMKHGYRGKVKWITRGWETKVLLDNGLITHCHIATLTKVSNTESKEE